MYLLHVHILYSHIYIYFLMSVLLLEYNNFIFNIIFKSIFIFIFCVCPCIECMIAFPRGQKRTLKPLELESHRQL